MMRRPAAIPAAPAPMITTSVSLLLAKFILREFARVVVLNVKQSPYGPRKRQHVVMSGKTSACVPVS